MGEGGQGGGEAGGFGDAGGASVEQFEGTGEQLLLPQGAFLRLAALLLHFIYAPDSQ